jgi:bifunctional non-homologous end joining protein LigD
MLKPMLAVLVDEPFDNENWVFETKWDGFRALAVKSKKLSLLSRNGKSFNAHFPEIVTELSKLPGNFILDGEVVLLDKKGRSHFQLLQNYKTTRKGTPYYYVFDILSHNGKSLKSLPLLSRKTILRKILKGPHLRYSNHTSTHGKKLFSLAKKHHLEGIIAKRKDSPYRNARSSDWRKIKTHRRQEVVIGGFTAPRRSRKYFGSLLVGVYDQGHLRYCGHVGGGFNQLLLQTTHAQLLKLKTPTCPFSQQPKPNEPVTWIRPQLVCEVSFAEWTKQGLLRQPIFEGMRPDKPAKKVIREKTL